MKKKELYIALGIYGSCWLIAILLYFIMATRGDTSFSDAVGFFPRAFTNSSSQIAVHIFFALVYLLFLIFRYFFRIYKKKGLKTSLKRFAYRFALPVTGVFLVFKLLVYSNGYEDFNYQWDPSIENSTGIAKDMYEKDGKHRGMSVFGWEDDNEVGISDLVRNNIEWVAVVPFMYQENPRTAVMGVPKKIGTWSRRDSSFIKTIGQLHAKGIHVQLKPHLWMSDGWRSSIKHDTEEGWDTWFDSYKANMLHYAQMAQISNVELLCIGTELKSSLKKQPERWRNLVSEIKEVYKGKLTYAANWDGEFELIDFWNELDYIGIQAYFPLTKEKNPPLEAILKGWDRHITKLEALHQKHQLPILFTEVGYKSDAAATIKPWEWSSLSSILVNQKSDETQQLAFEALYQRLWHKKWFAGTYIWEWNTRTSEDSSYQSLNFSPRFKPAENTIAKWYAKP